MSGISIRTCDDLGSYKKLIPTLEEFPEAFVVTADDDAFYGERWLETLVSAARPAQPLVVCRRAHQLTHAPDGFISPYLDWARDARFGRANLPSTDLVPIGVGGVLYPPGTFDPVVLDSERFMRLCPHGDDLWFYWTARMAGTRHLQCGGKFWQLTWIGTQENALWVENQEGRNDAMIKALEAEFGALSF